MSEFVETKTINVGTDDETEQILKCMSDNQFGGFKPVIDKMKEMHEKGQYSTTEEKLSDDEIEQLMECVSENELS